MNGSIFITGATSGFGAATARRFAANGWKVIATGRRVERLEALRDEFGADKVHIARLDLTERDSILAAVAGLPDEFRPVSCLMNNGGLALGANRVPDIGLEDWHTMIDTNITGLLHTTLALLDELKSAGPGASIINIGSVAAHYAYEGGNVYGGTKAFVRQFSYNLRADIADTDIRVNLVEPGMAKSEFTKVRHHGDDQANETFYEGMEPIRPEDVADTVWWLANRPAHININSVEIMPVAQNPGGFKVRRD